MVANWIHLLNHALQPWK